MFIPLTRALAILFSDVWELAVLRRSASNDAEKVSGPLPKPKHVKEVSRTGTAIAVWSEKQLRVGRAIVA